MRNKTIEMELQEEKITKQFFCWIDYGSQTFFIWETFNLIFHIIIALGKPLEFAFFDLMWVDYGIQSLYSWANLFFISDMFVQIVTQQEIMEK